MMDWKKVAVALVFTSIVLLTATGCPATQESAASSSNITTATVTSTATVTVTGESTVPGLAVVDLADVIAAVRPSVVAINTEVSYSSFFGSYTEDGAGSGWIIDPDGYIVTNNHVVEDASSIMVTLEDGRTFEAQAVYSDAYSDLAVLKIDAQDLPALETGDSTDIRVGDWVVAIGNSLGLGISATAGIVSATGVSISMSGSEDMYDLIQTDAAINPGNSGGPLINLAGEVIGINSVKVSDVGVEGMGYAISTAEALPVLQQLISTGYVSRPGLGVSLYEIDEYIAHHYQLPVDYGLLVTQVTENGAADDAGMEQGDIITAVNGQSTTTIQEIRNIIQAYETGQQVEVTFYRGDSEQKVMLTLSEASWE